MGSFNLGRIKGDRGEQGAKGDTGPKGDRGDKGDNGKDGLTPVFTVGETVTVSSGEEAYVEINTDNPASPVISFQIPRGQDGKDALGDMMSSIYDTEGIGEDIYKYAKRLTEGFLKVSGGNLEGALKASETTLLEGSVRNISARITLPENGAEGDICIIIKDRNSKKLGDLKEGDIVLLRENGEEVPYMAVALNHHKENSVTLMRKQLTSCEGRFNATKGHEYAMCETDIFLESMFKSTFSEEVRKHLLSVKLEDGVYRSCFILSSGDFSSINYLRTEANRITEKETTGERDSYITRTSNSQGTVVSITTVGTFSNLSYSDKTCYRPVIVLPSDMEVNNTQYQNTMAVKLPQPQYGIYMYIQGEWKECAGL